MADSRDDVELAESPVARKRVELKDQWQWSIAEFAALCGVSCPYLYERIHAAAGAREGWLDVAGARIPIHKDTARGAWRIWRLEAEHAITATITATQAAS